MASWTDDSAYTEPDDTDSTPLMGVTGGDRARQGDHYTLTFHDEGEEIETQNGDRIRFEATLEEASFSPVDGDRDPIADGDDVTFLTGSARFLSELAEHAPVAGSTLRVDVTGTGYDAGYSIAPADE